MLRLLLLLWVSQMVQARAWRVTLEGNITRGLVYLRPNITASQGYVCSDGFKSPSEETGSTRADNNNINHNALSVCHSVGFPSLAALYTPEFGDVDTTRPMWLGDVNCSSSDYYLENCSHAPLGQTSCQSGDAVGVQCSIPRNLWRFSLSGGAVSSSGLVLLKPLSGLPNGVVHRAAFDDEKEGIRLRRFLCTSLGWPTERPSTAFFVAPAGLPRYFKPVECSLSAARLEDCAAERDSPFLEEHYWPDEESLGIHCNYLDTSLVGLMLADGPRPWAGNLLVRYSPQESYGTSCYRGLSARWDPMDDSAMFVPTLNAICRQLGFSDVTGAKLRFYKQRSDPIRFDWNNCAGAHRLSECNISAFDDLPKGCTAATTAGVDCYPDRTMGDALVRLVGGFSDWAGQIQYRYNSTGAWTSLSVHAMSTSGSVFSTADMNTAALNAACYRAGHTSVTGARLRYFGQRALAPIWGDAARCDGVDSFHLCDIIAKANPVYSLGEYAGVDCFPERSASMSRVYRQSPTGVIEMQLVDSAVTTAWGSICVTELNAFSVWDAACASVGKGGRSSKRVRGVNGSLPMYLSSLVCPSSSATGGLGVCSSSPVGNHQCAEDDALVVNCDSVAIVPHKWEVTVLGGNGRSQGYVALRPTDTVIPGTFCASSDLAVLHAICRSLGFTNSTDPRMTIATGRAVGLGGFYFYNPTCSPYHNITQCTYSHFEAEMCDGMVIDCFPVVDDASLWSLRLVGGTVASEGRLEVRPTPDAGWGTVCGYSWSQSATVAACNSLGYALAGVVPRQRDINAFGYGVGPIWLSSMLCHSATWLQNCSYYFNPSGISSPGFYCAHGNDVALECAPPRVEPTRWEFRFAQYDILWPDRIRIEMRPSSNSEWGTIAQRSGSGEVAMAACGTAGYAFGVADRLPAVPGIGRVYAVDFDCPEGVQDLRNCSSDINQFGLLLDHTFDLTVDCNPILSDSSLWRFELRDGGGPTSGRLHVRPTSTAATGTVCAWGFSHASAVSACRSVGFVDPPPRAAQIYTNVAQQTFGRIWLEEMTCSALGPEDFLQNCTEYVFSGSGCTHADDVWIECYPRIEARLVDGPSPTRGRLEVRNMPLGAWGTVCNDVFGGSYHAWNAACRSAGFANATFALYEDWGAGSGLININLDDVSCPTAGEPTLTDCTFSPFGTSNCVHSEDAGVDCFPPLPASGWRYRLEGGLNATAGRVEIQPAAGLAWGGICPQPSFNHSYLAWMAACRSVGIGTARAVPRRYGFPTSGLMLLDNVVCTAAAASSIGEGCSHAPLGVYDCAASEAVGVDCAPPAVDPTQWNVRLTGAGGAATKGRVEVMFNTYGPDTEPWGTVCSNGGATLLNALLTVCAAAGHLTSTAPVVMLPSDDGFEVAPAWQPIYLSNLSCPSASTAFSGCTHDPLYSHACDHGQDLYVDCFPPTPPPSTAPPATTASTLPTTTTATTTTTVATTVTPTTITSTTTTTATAPTTATATTQFPTTAPTPTNRGTTTLRTTAPPTSPPTTFPTKAPLPACDLIRIVTDAIPSMTDERIRTQGLTMWLYSHDASVEGSTSMQSWKNMSELSVYRPSLNTLSQDVSDFFYFEDIFVGTREPEAFWKHFKEVGPESSSFIGGGTTSRIVCTLVNRTLIQCVLPATNSYDLSAAEGIAGWFRLPLSQMLSPSCLSDEVPRIVQVHIEADTRDAFGAAVDAIGTISNGAGAVIGALIGASVMEIQYVSIQMQSLCMSELDRRSSDAMRYFISPFVDFNFPAVAFGNVAIAVVAGLLQWGLSLKFMQGRGISKQDAWAAVRFPSLAYGISQVFFMGLCFGTFNMLSAGDDGLMLFGGIVALLLLGGYVALLLYFVRATVRARFIQYTQFLSKPASSRWLYPLGFWDPDNLRLSYGHMINPFRDECIRFNLQQFIVGILVSLIILISQIDCFVRFVLTALIFAVSACAHLYARPSRLPPVNFLCAVAQLVMAVWCVLSAVALKAPTKEVERAKLMLALCQVVVVLVRAGYEFTIAVLEESRWRNFRRPDMNGYRDDKRLQAEGGKKAFMEGIDMEELLRIGTGGGAAGRKGAQPLERGRVKTGRLAKHGAQQALPIASAEAPLLMEVSEDHSPLDLEMGEELSDVPTGFVPPLRITSPPHLSRTEVILREGMSGMLDAFPEAARQRHLEILIRLWELDEVADFSVVTDADIKEGIVMGLIAQRVNSARRVEVLAGQSSTADFTLASPHRDAMGQNMGLDEGGAILDVASGAPLEDLDLGTDEGLGGGVSYPAGEEEELILDEEVVDTTYYEL